MPEEKDSAPEKETPPAKASKKEESVSLDEDSKEALPGGEKLLAVLGYFSFLCVLPLAIKPQSKFCQHHGKQALVLAIVFLLLSWLGWFSLGMRVFLGLIHVIIALAAILHAWKGTMWKIPIIGDMAKKLKW
ncbi:MAG: DUF4870 domain-containing protein [Candidatus Gracilibacteria bacterium]|nr:DUF4870 domain-containing protein [Candidatus Gracilibacteria bacterium]